MRPRAELALGAGLVLALAIAAGLAGLGRARLTDADQRRSTFLAGPAGARGYADALARLGVRVERFRRPLGTLDSVPGLRTVVAFLGPSIGFDPRDGLAVASLHADLLLAGPGAAAAFRCLGWDVQPRFRDSLAVAPPGGRSAPFPRVHAVLVRGDSSVLVEAPGDGDAAPVRCTVPGAGRVDTLLRTTGGRPVAVRATLDDGRTITLVADDRLFANRALRRTGAGPFALGLVVPRYDRIIVDEYHHGFDASRSLAGAAAEWTLHSPWGWGVLQLVGVGVIALLAAGIRFGPVRAGVERRRRSSLEHVRALATALAAARGHDVAVGLLVQGLRRRLSRAGLSSRGEIDAWLDGLAPAVRGARGQAALETLITITRKPASADDVLHAASAVETLWEELTPT
ncbi:MAG TPA: DUF4350 domain-containing protein [Gemmatimonadales bacterium]|nr:DUF4350 domain-containing protein [Gemmatimonadales bacterium]